MRTTSWREGVLLGRPPVLLDRSRVYARIDALPFNRDPAARGTGKTPGLSHIAVRNNDWGNGLLQVYCVN
jgi:hypothetical protein